MTISRRSETSSKRSPPNWVSALVRAALVGVLGCCTFGRPAVAQDVPAPLPTPADTTQAAPPDSVFADSLGLDLSVPPAAPPAAAADGAGLDEPVTLTASDSLVITFGEDDAAGRDEDGAEAGGDRATLYGSATATYGEATLEAYQLDYLFDIEEVRAQGLPADTGLVGRPQFRQGEEVFEGERLAFNLGTERGRVVGARTAIDDGFVEGEVVKVTEDSTFFILAGRYTTCDCAPGETPSYSLRSKRMKIVDQQWVYTGPIRLYIFNIPTPLWLPFGFLPAQEGRRSGPLAPNYGEDEFGFFLRDWGWYWAINDYMDAQVQGGLWTKGSWQVNPSFRYAKRYRYSGQLGITYGRFRRGERADPDVAVQQTGSLRWAHSQTINPTTSLSSNVNLSSSSYLRSVSEQYEDRVRQSISSSINFSKSWRNSGRALRVAASQRQQLADGSVSMTLPNLTFSQNRRRLFGFLAGDGARGAQQPWYERVTYSYDGSFQNSYAFQRATRSELLAAGVDTAAVQAELDTIAEIDWYEGLVSRDKYQRATREVTPFLAEAEHRIPISANFNVNRLPVVNRTLPLNLSLNASYGERWYVQSTRVSAVDSTGRTEREAVPDFLRVEQLSTGGSVSTTFYGLFPWRLGRLNGFRHRANPSVTFTYQPDLTTPFWGNVDTYSYVDPRGEEVEVEYLRATGRPSTGLGKQQTFSFSLQNDLETKIVRTDSTGETTDRTLKLLDFGLSTSYNAAADSFGLAPLQVSARTSIDPGRGSRFGRLSLNLRSSLSPYPTADSTGRRLSQLIVRPEGTTLLGAFGRLGTGRFVQLDRLNISATTSLQSRNSDRSGPQGPTDAGAPLDPRTSLGPDLGYDTATRYPGDPFYNDAYADFSIPWSLNLTGSYNLTRTFDTQADRERFRRTATLNGSFRFSLTPRWQITGQSGYDFIEGEVVTTNLSINRDLDCWLMSFTWVPFGRYQSYSFNLQVKSGKLSQILRLNQPRGDVRGRFGGLAQGAL